MTIQKEHFVPMELADWQTSVKDKNLITAPESPSNGDRYIIAGIGGDWSGGTIKDIACYVASEWLFISPIEGMQVYVNDENLYYFYNGSNWTVVGGGDMLKTTYDVNDNGIVDKAESLDDDNGNEVSASEIVKALYNIVLLAFYRAIDNSKSLFNLIDGVVDEYEDESGIDTVNSVNEDYDSSGYYYSPDASSLDTSPYAHYKMNDDTNNTTVTDDGTGSNNGTLGGGDNTQDISSVGKINEAFDLNGTDDYIDVDLLEADIASDTTGSICFWFNADATTTREIFTISDADANTHLSIRINPTTGEVRVSLNEDPASVFNVYKSGVVSSGTWYHMVVVQDGVELKIYIDGALLTGLTWSSSVDKGAWMVDMSTLDTGRIGCSNNQSAGNASFFGGKIDDWRYYQNKALTLSEIEALYNDGDGTEADQPTGETENMTLISESQSAESEPDSARIVVFEEDVDAITLNTDLKAYISKDDGSTWAEATLEDDGDYDTNKRILVGNVDLSASGIGLGTDMIYKLVTDNKKDLKIHGTGLLWD